MTVNSVERMVENYINVNLATMQTCAITETRNLTVFNNFKQEYNWRRSLI